MEFNEERMKRFCFCKNCKRYYESNQPSPKCPSCGTKLYTVVFSMLDGKPITGVENDGEKA